MLIGSLGPGSRVWLDPPGQATFVDGKFYFVLHAPRQTGKPTLLRSLSASLTAGGRYAALTISLESFTSDDVATMMPQILRKLSDSARSQLPERYAPPDRAGFVSDPHVALEAYLGAWSAAIDRPLVVFFDEIDYVGSCRPPVNAYAPDLGRLRGLTLRSHVIILRRSARSG